MSLVTKLRKRFLAFALLTGGTLTLAAAAEAASVYNCSSSGEKCVVKVEEGIIGDRVKVMDEKARVIVDVENRDSNLQWAASFSGKE